MGVMYTLTMFYKDHIQYGRFCRKFFSLTEQDHLKLQRCKQRMMTVLKERSLRLSVSARRNTPKKCSSPLPL